MRIQYRDLIEQSFEFPQAPFSLDSDGLKFHGISLLKIAEEYGTPLKLTYLPRIQEQIERSRIFFQKSFERNHYQGNYHYSYCTKSSHFSFVIRKVLDSGAYLETSSAYDLNLINQLHAEERIDKDFLVLCNGYKTSTYISAIAKAHNQKKYRVLPIIDNIREAGLLAEQLEDACDVGIRIASEEDPKFEFYTSRLGIGYKDILPFYQNNIQSNAKLKLKMLHFFVNTGITDTAYYWNELSKCVRVYCDLKKECPSLSALNIGGGLPIKQSLDPKKQFNYQEVIGEIVRQVKAACQEAEIDEPDIFTEFGSYTVGESGAVIYSILDQKKQNDRERWNMIDSSFMTTLPDTWAINKRFIMLAINNWDQPYERVFLGGLSCDSDDYYNSEQHANTIYLPQFEQGRKQYIGFFHTGAYQESIGGYGGIQHCLIPAPKHLVIDRNDQGQLSIEEFAPIQKAEDMLQILGYDSGKS